MRYDKKIKQSLVASRLSLVLCLAALFCLAVRVHAQQPGGAVSGSVRLPTVAKEVQTARDAAGAKEALSAKEGGGGKGDTAKDVPEKENGELKEKAKTEAVGDSDSVYLNVQDQDIKDVIKQISKATGKNFIIDDKIRGKVTIMSEKTMTKEEAYQAFLSALEVAGFTTVTGPGGIIKVVALADAKKSPIPIHMDSTPYTDSYVTRLIQLKNISALEMSSAIKELISKNGNMFAYPATNTLIITDSGTNIDRLMKLIKELDQEGPQQILEIIPIKHADAKDIATKVLSIFEIDQKGAAAGPKKGAELEEIKDVSKIIADERTNSLIVLASKRAIDKVRDIIGKLDMPLATGDTGTIHVHYLKFAKATELAQTLAAITKGGSSPAPLSAKPGDSKTAAPKGPPPVAQLEGGVSIGADEITNALIITASQKDYQILVEELISKLDVPRRQVYLEAIVMELELAKGKQMGVSGFGGGGGKSMIGFGNYGSNEFNALTGLFNPAGFFATPGLLGGLLSRDSVTVQVPKSGGGTQDLTIPAFSAFLNLLQTYRDANIVSTPNIMTVDNQKASIEVSRKVWYQKPTIVATAGTTTSGADSVDAGLTLEITPQITEGDAVRLEIHHKLENFTGPALSPNVPPPSTKREITTTVVAMDGQTVVLGGLMEDVQLHQKSKVPILGDIPLIGLLFRQSSTSTEKRNMIIFITPHVVKDPSDFAEVSKAKIDQRNKFIDANFGKKQRQLIRDTIAIHRADLLEYTAPTAFETSSSIDEPKPLPLNPPPPASATSRNKKSPPTPAPSSAPMKAPVITVSPVGAYDSGSKSQELSSRKSAGSSSKKGREPGELDSAN